MAIGKEAYGIIFVFNPETPNLGEEMDYYVKNFASAINIPPNQCLALANHFNTGG